MTSLADSPSPLQAFALIKRRKARAAAINEKSGWYAQADNPEDDPWTAPTNRESLRTPSFSALVDPRLTSPSLPSV